MTVRNGNLELPATVSRFLLFVKLNLISSWRSRNHFIAKDGERKSSTNEYLQKETKNNKKKTSYKNMNLFYYINTDEIPGFFLLPKNHIFIVRSEDTIFIFHVYWCRHGY